MPRFAAKCPDLPKALFQHILSNDREKIANRGKMRQIAATNRSQNVVKMGKFYYRGFSGILGFHEMYTFRQGCTNWICLYTFNAYHNCPTACTRYIGSHLSSIALPHSSMLSYVRRNTPAAMPHQNLHLCELHG